MQTLKRWLPMMVLVVVAGVMVGWGRIPQAAHYHQFADTRPLLGVANGGDVLSNLAFAVVAAWGIAWLARAGTGTRLAPSIAGLWIFMVALALTSLGSGYYHLAPENDRLVWDRLPIALACAGLLGASYTRTHDTPLTLTIPFALAAFGVATVYWWAATEARGVGDLRPYILLQGAPLVLVPLWQWQAGSPRRERAAFAIAVLVYVLAKVAELNDRAIFEALGVLSGHTLKHLLAAVASAFIIASFHEERDPAARVQPPAA
jgi:hypothetical protein